MTEETALAKTTDQPSLMEFGGGGQRLATSLDLKDKKARRTLLAATQNCDKRLTECVGEEIAVVDYVVHDVEIKGRTDGEIIAGARLVLVDKAGKTYETVGLTFLRSFQRIVYTEGAPPWEKPLVLVPRMKKKAEFSIYWFDLKS